MLRLKGKADLLDLDIKILLVFPQTNWTVLTWTAWLICVDSLFQLYFISFFWFLLFWFLLLCVPFVKFCFNFLQA